MNEIKTKNCFFTSNLRKCRALFILWMSLVSLYLLPSPAHASGIWVGESVTCDAASAVMGLTSGVSWTTSGGYLSLSGTGFYRTVKATQYFGGSATVKCTWKYRLYSGDTWKTQSKTWTFTCNENPVSISPAEMSLSMGGTGYVSYSHKYSNSYTSAANVYYSSSNVSVATVTSDGKVTAVGQGSCYITVYSKLSNAAKAPSCKVTVKNVDVKSIEIPSATSVTAGSTTSIQIKKNPSDATVKSVSWYSRNNNIATVSNGVITGVHHGSTSVYCIVNGNVTSNDCSVTVNKQTLSLSADFSSGLVSKGTKVSLKAGADDAQIYYTLDGTTPNKSKQRYSTPIIISKVCKLRAIAYHEDYIASKVLERDFTVTSLAIASTYPTNNSTDVFRSVIPSITFNAPINLVDADAISMLHNGNVVSGHPYIDGNTLYYALDQAQEKGTCELVVKEGAVSSSDGINPTLSLKYQLRKNLVRVKGVKSVKNIVVNDKITYYFIDDEDNLYGFGDNRYGLAGVDDSSVEAVYTPVKISTGVKNVIQGSLGFRCGYITNANDLYIWGSNKCGEVGDGTKQDKYRPQLIKSKVKEASFDYVSSYAITEDGKVWAWGSFIDGELVSNSQNNPSSPVEVLNISNAQNIYSDFYNAIAYDGEKLWGWGDNSHGTLGMGNTTKKVRPQVIMQEKNLKKILQMQGSVYVIKSDNSLWAWGDNDYGQIGDGTTKDRLSPVKVADNIKDIFRGYTAFFALSEDGTLYACGANYYKDLGSESRNISTLTAVCENVKKVSSDGVTGILKDDGTLWVCGQNYYGQLCNGTKDNTHILNKIAEEVEDVCCNELGGAFIKRDGSLWTFGYGIVGDGTEEKITHNPTKIVSVDAAELEKVEMSYKAIKVSVGVSVPLQIKLFPVNANASIRVWSDDENIASVSSVGIVKAVSVGKTTVHVEATADNGSVYEETCDVTVVPATSSGMNQILVNDEPIVEIYNLNGQKLAKPSSGINIINGKKVIIK